MKAKPPLDLSSRYICCAGLVCAGIGLAVMTGWYIGSHSLVRFSLHHPPLAFNGALGIMLCGLALYAFVAERRRVLTACSSLAILIGLATVLEHTTGWNLGLDNLLARPFTPVSELHPGRMTFPAAVCLVLTGCAILVLIRPHTSRLRQLIPSNLSWLAIAFGTISLLSYASQLEVEYIKGMDLRMSLPGALGFILLGSGINVAAIHKYPFSEIRIKHLRNSVVINSTAGVLILILVSAAMGVWPLYARLQQNENREIQYAAHYKANEVKQFVNRAEDLARQVASRTRARTLLARHNQGTLEAGAFVEETTRILQDALSQSPLLLGITRLDQRGITVVETGLPIPPVRWPVPAPPSSAIILSHPQIVGDQAMVAVRSPINAPDGTRMGTDLLLLSAQPLAEILKRPFATSLHLQLHLVCSGPGVFEVFAPDTVHQTLESIDPEKERNLYRNIQDRIKASGPGGVMQPDEEDGQTLQSAYSTVAGPEWIVIATADIKDLHRVMNQHLLLSFGAVFLLALFGAGGMLMLVRPMTSGIIVQAEVMEARVNRATVSLERELVARKTEQQATREIAEDFRRALNEAPLPIMIYTEDGEVLMVNKAWTQTSGYTLNDVPSMHQWREAAMHDALDASVPERAPAANTDEEIQLPPAGGAMPDGEHSITAKNGSRLIWHFRTAPLRSRSVGRLKYVSMAVDITARKSAEAELNQFFVLSEEMLCICGFDGYFKRVNPAFTEVLGYPEETLLRTPMMDLVHPDDRESTRIEMARLEDGEATLNFENRYRTRDGEYRWLMWSSHPAREDQLVYAAARDITEARQASRKIQKTMEALEKSNEELEKFAYVASHDLQEPLRTVGGFTQLLERNYKGKLDAEADEYLEFIRTGAQRAQLLINDLLEFSRVGTQGKNFAPVDCNQLLSTLRDNMHLAIQECGAELVVSGDLPVVMGDALQLNQVFQNLISNALKFRKEAPPPRIEISAKREGKDWVFAVKDNGIGMEEEYFERIFTIFQRLHGERYPGTGLGLAICKKVIERHGGTLYLESELDRGTTFYFSLPYHQIPRSPPPGGKAPKPAGA